MNCPKSGPTIPIRFVMAAMVGLACMIHAIIRSCMSIIILAMTKNPYDPTEVLPDYGVRYEWSTYDQSLVLGSYFWGGIVSCAAGGVLTGRYGPRYVLGFAFAFATVLAAVSPVGAQFLWLAILIRFLSGVVLGVTFPACHGLVANWAPPEEKGKFLSLMHLTAIGAVIDWSMSGHIIEQYGWVYAFYVVSVIFALFTVLWFLVVRDSPCNQFRITPLPPFRSIFTSIPFWALVCFHFGDLCGYFFLLTSVPRYLTTGLLSSIPTLSIFPAGIVFALIGDYILKREKMTANALAKWFSLCSHSVPGCCLLLVTVVGNQPYFCVALMTVALVFNAVVITKLHHIHDMTPNFASTIYGLISTVGFSAGYLSPLVVAYFTAERSTEEEWRKLFYLGAGLMFLGNIIFILFGNGHVQKWNSIDKEAENENMQMEKSFLIK